MLGELSRLLLSYYTYTCNHLGWRMCPKIAYNYFVLSLVQVCEAHKNFHVNDTRHKVKLVWSIWFDLSLYKMDRFLMCAFGLLFLENLIKFTRIRKVVFPVFREWYQLFYFFHFNLKYKDQNLFFFISKNKTPHYSSDILKWEFFTVFLCIDSNDFPHWTLRSKFNEKNSERLSPYRTMKCYGISW